MADINLKLLLNNTIEVTTTEQSYRVVAGEQNTTQFVIERPTGYDDWSLSYEMVNAQGNGFTETVITNNKFFFPASMAVPGYCDIIIRARKDGVVKVWVPLHLKVWQGLPSWGTAASTLELQQKK